MFILTLHNIEGKFHSKLILCQIILNNFPFVLDYQILICVFGQKWWQTFNCLLIDFSNQFNNEMNF